MQALKCDQCNEPGMAHNEYGDWLCDQCFVEDMQAEAELEELAARLAG